MDGGDVESLPSSEKTKTLHELFDELCPCYMQYGMTYEQFWYGDPLMARAFRKLWRLQQEEANRQAWMQGLYIYDAVSSAIHNAFSKGQRKSYIEEPIRIFPMTEEEEEAEIRKQQQKVMEFLKDQARMQNAEKAEETDNGK